MFEQLRLNVLNGLRESFTEFVKIFLVEKDLVLFVFIITDTFALRDGDVEVLFGLRGFHIEEVGALPCAYPLRKDLIFVAVIILQCTLLMMDKLN